MMISQTGQEGPVIQLEMKFRAPRPKIYQVWTDPDLLARWHLADEGFRCLRAEVNLQPFGQFDIEMEDPPGENQFLVTGNYVEIVPEERLVYTWAAMSDPRYWTMVTARFTDDGEGSALQLTHGIFASEEDRILHEQGWAGCLNMLSKLLDDPVAE